MTALSLPGIGELPGLGELAGALTVTEPRADEELIISRVWTSSDRRAIVSLRSTATSLFWTAWVRELSPVAEGDQWWKSSNTGRTIVEVKNEGKALPWDIYEQSGLQIATAPGKNSIGSAIRSGAAPVGYSPRVRPTLPALVGSGVAVFFLWKWLRG